MGVPMSTFPDADLGIPKGGGRSHTRPHAPERRRRSGGRGATARRPTTCAGADVPIGRAFSCPSTPDV